MLRLTSSASFPEPAIPYSETIVTVLRSREGLKIYSLLNKLVSVLQDSGKAYT